MLLALAANGPAQAAQKYASLIADAATGNVIHARHIDQKRYPASLTKMMTLYLVFDALDEGKLTLDQRLRVSRHAAGKPASKLWLKAGRQIKVKDAVLAVITKSANDAATVLAEAVGGNEVVFARQMTRKARALGMKSTNFRNATGLPHRKQTTTARDMAVLARALMLHHADKFDLFATKSFVWKGRRHTNTNNLLGRYKGANGIKTGYIRASGFNLVATVERNGHQVIGIVMGGRSPQRRDKHLVKLLDRSFAKLKHGTQLTETTILGVPQPHLKGQPGLASDRKDYFLAMRDRNSKATLLAAVLPRPNLNPKRVPSAAPVQLASVSLPVTPNLKPAKTGKPSVRVARATTGGGQDWAVQVGATSSYDAALNLAATAITKAPALLAASQINVAEGPGGQKPLYRARLEKLSRQQANRLCDVLTRKSMSCMVIKPGDARMASL